VKAGRARAKGAALGQAARILRRIQRRRSGKEDELENRRKRAHAKEGKQKKEEEQKK
jgi:hypothetical protein